VRGTLGELGTGRDGARGPMPPCPGAWEHSTGRQISYFGLAASSGECWVTEGVEAGSAQGCWEHLGVSDFVYST